MNDNTPRRARRARDHARKQRTPSPLVTAGVLLLVAAVIGGVAGWFLAQSPAPGNAVAVSPTTAPEPNGAHATMPTAVTATPTALAGTPQAVSFPTATLSPLAPVTGAAPAPEPVPRYAVFREPPDDFFHPRRFSYIPDFYQPEINALLSQNNSSLLNVRFQVGSRSHSFADVLVSMASLYSVSPAIGLALLESQSALVTTAQPSPEQTQWAMGFYGDNGSQAGLFSQLRWGMFALRGALRDYALHARGAPLPPLEYADGSKVEVTSSMGLAEYALARTLARTVNPGGLDAAMNRFVTTYARMFGDPRTVPDDWHAPAAPFLVMPMERPIRVTSFFDHDTPLLQPNGTVTAFWGITDAQLSYDGHTGWDYGMFDTDAILAAAPGTVVFAGNSDDGCATPAGAVIIEHGNGYRTLYWHFSRVDVEIGQEVAARDQLGMAGATGCAFGPHLHFQVQYHGRDVDPYGWCGNADSPWATNPAGNESHWLWADMPCPCAPPPPGTLLVDNTSPGFKTQGEWQSSPLGYGGGALFTASTFGAPRGRAGEVRVVAETPAVAVWETTFPTDGRYRVLAYVPYVLNGMDDSRAVRYVVQAGTTHAATTINAEQHANFWADLGTYDFAAGDQSRVILSTLAGDNGRGLWADAVAWVPVADADDAAPPTAATK